MVPELFTGIPLVLPAFVTGVDSLTSSVTRLFTALTGIPLACDSLALRFAIEPVLPELPSDLFVGMREAWVPLPALVGILEVALATLFFCIIRSVSECVTSFGDSRVEAVVAPRVKLCARFITRGLEAEPTTRELVLREIGLRAFGNDFVSFLFLAR